MRQREAMIEGVNSSMPAALLRICYAKSSFGRKDKQAAHFALFRPKDGFMQREEFTPSLFVCSHLTLWP